MTVIAIDLSTNKIVTAIFKGNGDLIESKKRPLGDLRATQVGHFLSQQIDDFIKKAEKRDLSVKAIGISVPGIYYEESGVVWAPNIPGWRNYPLLEDLKKYTIPVKIMSDRCCQILGEHWKGAAKACKNSIYFSVSSGICAGIMIDGRILRGANNIAGAIGWLSCENDYKESYGRCGHLEYYASGKGIALRAYKMALECKDYDSLLVKEDLNVQDVFNAYKYEDPIAVKVLDTAVKYWGVSIANLISIFNPNKVILGGSVFGPATQFKQRIYAEAAKWAQPISMQDASLVLSKLGNQAGLLGAGRLALITAEELQL
ncbi:MAG: ROK family protein [Candidatus Neomarinimicrobiota bacterium]|jgi:glucokinase